MLGRLRHVDLRNIWQSESAHFTPWLAQEENLSPLGETLRLDLQLEAQERSVGPFRADILCKDIGSDSWVLVENQLERTDHTHLGQLLTYASGLDAVTIVWIAAQFTEEHRSTLDWLNKITNESFKFFGLEVELWSIGDSVAAPKFNIVSKPNNWSRSVARSARAIDEAELTDTRMMQRDYWDGLHGHLNRLQGAVTGNRTSQPQNWMAYSVGRANFNVGTTMLRKEHMLRADLYISGTKANAFFAQLHTQKEQIEEELGYRLTWEDLPHAQDCRIAAYLEDANPEDRSDWNRQHAWLAEKVNELHAAFATRLQQLR